jgi:formate dehydrogenase subunit gamma
MPYILRAVSLLLALFCLSWSSLGYAQTTQTSPPGTAGKELNILDLPKQQVERSQSQPGNNQPVWSAVRAGAPSAYASIPGREVNVLIQNEGQAWRVMRNNKIAAYGGWALVLIMALIGLFYAWKGTIQLKEAPTGRLIERFTFAERMAHWTTAICFVVLAVSGLLLAFGKAVMLPIIGPTLFGFFAMLSKNLHNFIGPIFCVSIIITFLTFVRDNIPKAIDFQWIISFGGLLSGKHVPSERFNAGEKVWFWFGLLGLGVVVGASGLVLDFPNFDQTRATMQLANQVHFIAALVFMIGACGHIYMGTLGMAGAYDAMRQGTVDEAWAKEHHEVWFNDIKAGRIPAFRSNNSANLAGTGDD